MLLEILHTLKSQSYSAMLTMQRQIVTDLLLKVSEYYSRCDVG